MNGQPSMKRNMVLNTLRSLMSVLFPLITFPYASKVLGVENVGRYNFANSIVSYFLLIAGLGIEKYAIREGAVLRERRAAFARFSDEMFTINLLSTLVAYALFAAAMLLVPRFAAYRALLLVLSLQIAFKLIGVEWLYSVYEDYVYITVRSIAFQAVSLILLFVAVKSERDLLVYAGIFVVSAVGSSLLNYLHARRYHMPRPTGGVRWRAHLKPILVLFAMSATITVYVASDMSILGFLCDDYTVGIYAVSTKIYAIVKQLLSAALVVSIPRLSMYFAGAERARFDQAASDIYKTLFSLLFPAMVGMLLLRREIITLISDETYLQATESFSILCVALLFCMLAWFWGQCILIPAKREKQVFMATVVSACLNIALNLALIPIYRERAAAFTTALSECVAFVWCWRASKGLVRIRGAAAVLLKVLLGCGCIVGCVCLARRLAVSDTLYLCLSVVASAAVYFAVEYALKNEAIAGFVRAGRRPRA